MGAIWTLRMACQFPLLQAKTCPSSSLRSGVLFPESEEEIRK
jgi:hypothetical protein